MIITREQIENIFQDERVKNQADCLRRKWNMLYGLLKSARTDNERILLARPMLTVSQQLRYLIRHESQGDFLKIANAIANI
jgi:hypothetical protein